MEESFCTSQAVFFFTAYTLATTPVRGKYLSDYVLKRRDKAANVADYSCVGFNLCQEESKEP